MIAEKTDGYSGADIEILCKDAAMMPLRFAQMTQYFKPVSTPEGTKYMPTNSSGPGVKNCSVYELPDRGLKLPELTREDLFQACAKAKPSVNQADLKEYNDWTEQFGIQD